MKKNIVIIFSILILFASSSSTSVFGTFGTDLVTSYDIDRLIREIDRLVLELRKQFNAENGCDYFDMKNLALAIEKGEVNTTTTLTDKCDFFYYDCMVALNDDAKTRGNNLTDVIKYHIIPLEKWCD